MSEETNKYIAITLGPITRTIEMAENTRGLWAASYLFSYLGKKIIEPFMELKRPFLLPKITKEMFQSNQFGGAGIFPDLYIFKSENGDFDKLAKQVDSVLDNLAKEMVNVINRQDKKEDASLYNEAKKERVKAFLDKYLKVYFFEKSFKVEENVKESCEKSLALIEMQDSFLTQANDADSFLSRFFRKIPNSFLTRDAGLNNGFPSIVEISSNSDAEVPKHPYQRYVAIVKADGDSMGRALQSMTDATQLSEALLAFNKKATKTIKDHNGFAIYTGGDDLLFIAPIYTEIDIIEENVTKKKKVSIFSLLQALDNDFHTCMTTEGKLDDISKHPTLSFGVSVSYYKFPMFEALKLADELLNQAKGYNAPKEESSYVWKNNIAFSVQKHSGQTRAALLHKGHTEVLEKFNTLIDKYLLVESQGETPAEKKENKKILTSLMHGLREKESLLSLAVKDENTLTNFFANNFNETGHGKCREFFDDIKEMLLQTYKAYSDSNVLNHLKYSLPKYVKDEEGNPILEKSVIEVVYNALQFIHLVNKRNDERDENI